VQNEWVFCLVGFFPLSTGCLKLILLWSNVKLGSELYLLEGAASSPFTAAAAGRNDLGAGENGAGFWEEAWVQLGISLAVLRAEIVYSVFAIYNHWRSWPLVCLSQDHVPFSSF